MKPKRTNGAAIPPGWDAARSVTRAEEREAAFTGAPRETIEAFLDGDHARIVKPAEGFIPQDWPVRDQGHRGTCNAFAVVAAEELSRWMDSDTLQPLSEEFLYADMRRQPLTGVVVDQNALHESGATFLLQAKASLEESKLFPSGLLSYNDNPALPPNWTVDRLPDAAHAVARHDSYVHNIWKTPDLSPDDGNWRDTLPKDTLVEVFLEQLTSNVPVVASFALFDPPGSGILTNPEARLYGRLRYPPYEVVTTLKPTFGHTVCIMGFLVDPAAPVVATIPADEGEEPEDPLFPGWFIFRNSYGAFSFGQDNDPSLPHPNGILPGYGLIHARDVERYCWEYLYRG